MFDDDFHDDEDQIGELLGNYGRLKRGEAASFMDEEDFESVIDYYFRSANEELALEACELAKSYFPYSVSLMLLKAEILTQSQKYGQALHVLDELEQFDDSNLDAILLRSDIYMSQFKHDQAANWLEKQADKFSGKEKAELLLELADVYDENEDFNTVFDTLKRVIEIDRKSEEALQKICFWADFTNRLDESVALHIALTDEDPFNALAWFNLGAAYQGLKLYEKSVDAYQNCVAIDEKFEFAYRNMADDFMRLKQYEKALEMLESHIEIAKPEDVIFEAMAFCWEKKKDYSKARYYYRKASRLSPDDDTIFYKIGETYAREQQWEKAVKSFSTALHLDKENASYCMAIGHCLMEMNVQNEALVCYLNAVRLKPTSKSTWIALIRGLHVIGLYEEALTQIEMARQNCGDKGDFAFLQAAALLEMGKGKDALINLEKAMKLSPKKLKLFTELNPEYLLRSNVAEIVARYKKIK